MHKVKKYSLIVLLPIVISILHQGLFSSFKIFGIGFDLGFVFLICYSLLREDVECIVMALILGIIRDCFFPSVFGLNTIVYVLTAYILCKLERKIYKDAILIPMISTFIFTIFKSVLYYLYLYFASVEFNFAEHILNVMPLEAILNSILSIFIFRIVSKINSFKFMQEEWKF